MSNFSILVMTCAIMALVENGIIQSANAAYSRRVKRKTVENSEGIAWPDKIIPYVIENGFTKEQQGQINEALNEWTAVSCVKFEPFNPKIHKYKASINQKRQGCFSNLGYVGKILMNQRIPVYEQNINLNSNEGCTNRVVVLHEVGHSLGLIHEHSRPDRDNYITVIKDNVIPSQWSQLDKVTNGKTFDLPYEYQSIMHYSPNYFAKPGLFSFVTKDPSQMNEVFQDKSKPLSFTDVAAINIMYSCGNHCKNLCSKPGYLDKDCNCVTPWGYAEKTCKDEKSSDECKKISNNGEKCYIRGRYQGYQQIFNITNEEVVRPCRKTCGECYRYIPADWSNYPTAPKSVGPNKKEIVPTNTNGPTANPIETTTKSDSVGVETKNGNTIVKTKYRIISRKTEVRISNRRIFRQIRINNAK